MVSAIARTLGLAASATESLMAPLASVSPSFGQAASLEQVAHRPWPLADRPWLMAPSWEDLLFAHWPVEPSELRRSVPNELPIDTHDGAAWIAVTPFRVSAFRLRGLPHVPGVTSFAETNVRTYATVDDKPGIYFLSLDAASRLAVAGARRAFRLPYFLARMSARRMGDRVEYRSRRIAQGGRTAELDVRYRPTGPRFTAREGSLEHFLTERYCLYTVDQSKRLSRADIHHAPWALQPAEATFSLNTMARAAGQCLPDSQPLLHFAGRQDVLIWRLVRRGP